MQSIFSVPHFNNSITAIGNKPALVKDQQEESLCRYTCNSKGWYPKPQVIWTTYGGGKKHMEIKTSITWSETDLFVVQSIVAVPCDDVDVKCVIMLIKEKINRAGRFLESFWVGRDLKDLVFLTTLMWAGMPPTN